MTEPSRRERLKPVEYLVIAGIGAVFTGLVVLLGTRDWLLVGVFSLAAFIVLLVTIATLMLTVKPEGRSSADLDKRDGFEP